jgi:hypothetical protein
MFKLFGMLHALDAADVTIQVPDLPKQAGFLELPLLNVTFT